MASGGPVRELCEEVTCPICLEYFRDPVTIAECGHNFCRACLTCSWGESGGEASCPQCRGKAQEGNLRPNRQLANIVEIAQKLSLQVEEARKEEARERICEKHREPLKLFCQTDEILVCMICDKSKEHKSHEVIPAKEAAQEYKDKIFDCLETLRTEREEILEYIQDVEDESQELLRRTESERQTRVAEFRTLHQLLNKHEKDLLAQIEETEKDIARKRDEHLAKLSEELSSLESLIREMEEKHQQAGNELLQDVRSTLQRFEKKETFENPEAFPIELTCPVRYRRHKRFLELAMLRFRDILRWAFPERRATVTVDPASASSHAVLCLNQETIEWQSETQDLSEDPEKRYGFVLGREGFTTGCHFWEVDVFGEGWAVGVARKPVKGRVTLTPEEGIWAVGRWKGQYKVFVKGTDPPLTMMLESDSIRICLNYEGRAVAFYDADTTGLLNEFSGASFSGETLYPFFAVYDSGCLWLSP
ncbi:PREDICTED: E3 ubiquitin-protein ligase TRIM39-like [Gekko japonicus]|uniref:E3 ubiquitin-protein ligase TRIM39-like n=1 Tax=Gekko japonicus TaxID=146911 RepID=A0ABM1L1W8_GEKJA|nr:PREDICTED: E3 ubiquitin-protein ligase TRIM39-like [Gekko japonicus]